MAGLGNDCGECNEESVKMDLQCRQSLSLMEWRLSATKINVNGLIARLSPFGRIRLDVPSCPDVSKNYYKEVGAHWLMIARTSERTATGSSRGRCA